MSRSGRPYVIGFAGLLAGVALLFSVAGRMAKLPDPNGYDRWAAIAARIPESVRDLQPINAAAFALFAAEYPGLVEEVERALQQPAAVPLKAGQEWLAEQATEFMSVRNLETALLALARHGESTGDSLAAVRGRVAAVELG